MERFLFKQKLYAHNFLSKELLEEVNRKKQVFVISASKPVFPRKKSLLNIVTRSNYPCKFFLYRT